MNLFKKSTSNTGSYEELLDQTLYTAPSTNNKITWADAVEGTLILGATGSGKSSGPGLQIALAMLRSGFGFCVLCAKPDEKARWVRYAKETGRTDDLVIFNKQSGLSFNFLQYEMERSGEGAGEIINANNALMNLNEQLRLFTSGSSGRGDERYWDNGLRRIISRTITFLKLADVEVNIQNMRKVVAYCFSEEEARVYLQLKGIINSHEQIDPVKRQEAKTDLEFWAKSNYFVHLLDVIKRNKNLEDDEDSLLAVNYWINEFSRLDEKSRGIIAESFMGIIEPFLNDGILKNQFSCGLDEDLIPENIIAQKKIVIIDFPLKEFGLAGVFAATIYKTTFQAAMERRNIEKETDPKPVGLWIDEYHSFCNPQTDSLFQTTARSSWVACVYITQNINNLFCVMGNNQPEARAKSLLGNLNLKYFGSNDNFDTNIWASNMIGQHMVDFQTVNFSKDMEISKSKNQQMQYRVTPDHFTTLKTGRIANNFMVEAVVFKSGKLWGKEKHNFALVAFNQRG